MNEFRLERFVESKGDGVDLLARYCTLTLVDAQLFRCESDVLILRSVDEDLHLQERWHGTARQLQSLKFHVHPSSASKADLTSASACFDLGLILHSNGLGILSILELAQIEGAYVLKHTLVFIR